MKKQTDVLTENLIKLQDITIRIKNFIELRVKRTNPELANKLLRNIISIEKILFSAINERHNIR